MKLQEKQRKITAYILIAIASFGCKKLTQVPEPVNTITTQETFSTDATATSAIVGIYNYAMNANGSLSLANGKATLDLGMSADELHLFNGPSPFELNTLSTTGSNSDDLWRSAYYAIYLSNAAIEALPISNGVSAPLKKQLTGEAKFFRAFFNFYLVNLYGDIPLVTTTAYRTNDTLHRTSTNKVYEQIIADLKDSQNSLAVDYSISGGERIRVNQSGATALLARVYLYLGDYNKDQSNYANAEIQASSVINNTALYQMESDLNNVFLANSSETILQFQVANTYPYSTQEGNRLITANATSNPNYYLTSQLIGAFESGDKRRIQWVDSTNYAGTIYYYPYKYKVRVGTQDNITEYYMVLRLAEQYLIRAEARARQNKLTGANGAISDLNFIRQRAGLPTISSTITQSQVLALIAQERRIELFGEWGHRWLDLKRAGIADQVLGAIKPTWKPTAKLYPIPASELVNDANLAQNPGY